jgi:serine/threonine-protein kinase RsbT
MMVADARDVPLNSDYDIVLARQCAREMAKELGFNLIDQTRIATAISEVARQTLLHRGHGMMHFRSIGRGGRTGLEFNCTCGQWIKTAAGGDEILKGVQRLVDEFELIPAEGEDFTVVMRKWKP